MRVPLTLQDLVPKLPPHLVDRVSEFFSADTLFLVAPKQMDQFFAACAAAVGEIIKEGLRFPVRKGNAHAVFPYLRIAQKPNFNFVQSTRLLFSAVLIIGVSGRQSPAKTSNYELSFIGN